MRRLNENELNELVHVTGQIPTFTGASNLAVSVFEALAGLRTTQASYSFAMRENYSQVRKMKTALRGIPSMIGNAVKNGECQMADNNYSIQDCESCASSIPSFTVKQKAVAHVNRMIKKMKSHVPKQFLYYVNDIYVILVEGIRVIDKVSTCLDDKPANECNTRDTGFAFFASRMRDIGKKEKEHVKLVLAEKTKVGIAADHLTEQVKVSLSALLSCLTVKNGTSLLADMDHDLDLTAEAGRVKLNFGESKYNDMAKLIEETVKGVSPKLG